jgi:glycosyltransferase involved in cell wall biosynthesis
MKRILHLISHLEEGGAQKQLAYLLTFSKQYEHEIASLIASPPEKLNSFFNDSAFPVHFLSQSADFYAPEILPRLDRLLISRSYNVVHCWLYQSIVQGVLAARKARISCIASPRSMHDMFRYEKNKSWEKHLVRRTMSMSDLVLCPSSSVAMDYLDRNWASAERIRVVRNGVDMEHFQPGASTDAVVAVGRATAEKTHGDFESIAQQLKAKHPQVRWIVAGGTETKSNGIEFVGYQNDIREVLNRAMIYISTSCTEGMSNALLESQAMGIPAVVRYLGSNSEIIQNRVNGFLARELVDFVNYSGALLEDESMRKEMGVKARERMCSDFAIKKQIEKIESIYSELL